MKGKQTTNLDYSDLLIENARSVEMGSPKYLKVLLGEVSPARE
jgi:hypothetical protein